WLTSINRWQAFYHQVDRSRIRTICGLLDWVLLDRQTKSFYHQNTQSTALRIPHIRARRFAKVLE
ncbi:MAG: hypothetical protein KDE54_28630, partial [Caldilineaceae bacterium]|nr:hypothetical protein [Caldilineaceae bacterium]